MNQTLSMIAHETRLMWKEFKFSVKRPLTKILITVVTLSVIVVNLSLEFGLSSMFEASPDLGEQLLGSLSDLGLTSSVVSGILYFLLLMFFISSFVRGIISSNFGFLFTRTDEKIIIPSPIAPHALYVAKKFRGLILHALAVATILLAAFPLVTRIGFQGLRLAILFITLLALIEVYGLVDNISYCMSRSLFRRGTQINRLALTAFVAWSEFVVASSLLVFFWGETLTYLAYLYPPYVCSMILALSPSFDISVGVFFLLAEVFVFFFIASAIAESGLRTWASSPRFVQTRSTFIPLRKNKLTWRTGKKSGARLILAKDLWVTFRNPSKFFIPLAVNLVLLFFVIELQSTFTFNPQQLPGLRFAEAILVPSIYLVTVFMLTPAWDSFASERRTLFILKSSPIKASEIVRSKYLFALMQSASYVVPLVAAISLLLSRAPDIFLISLEVTLVLLVSNAVGILASVSYPPAYRGIGPPPFLILLGLPVLCVMLTVIVPLSLLLSYPFATLQGVLLALMVFSVLEVVPALARQRWLALIVISPIYLWLSYPYFTSFDFAFAFMLYYVFIVVTSCLKRAEKSSGKLEEFRGRY